MLLWRPPPAAVEEPGVESGRSLHFAGGNRSAANLRFQPRAVSSAFGLVRRLLPISQIRVRSYNLEDGAAHLLAAGPFVP